MQQSQKKREVTVRIDGKEYSLEEAHALAIKEYSLGNFQVAVDMYNLIIAASPDFVEGYINRGLAHQSLKHYGDALANYDKAIALYPHHALPYFNRGITLQSLKRYDDALVSYDKAIALDSTNAAAYFYRGIILHALKQYDAAVESYEKAIILTPQDANAHINKGAILHEMGRYNEALASYEQSITLNNNPKAWWYKSIIKLTLGEYREGWKLYEWRWQNKPESVRSFREPLWLGEEALVHKTLLLHTEQGYGDTIQFCRYVSLIEALGAKVILEVPSPLMELMSTLKGSYHLVEQGSTLPAFDFHCPLMSLPLACKTGLEIIPDTVPYLFVHPQKRAIWQARLGHKVRPRVGLVMSGSATHINDRNRTINPEFLAPLLDEHVDFHLIQREMRPEEMAFLTNKANVTLHADHLNDFSDTAALLDEMDLVVSVDTAVAHLAGALGKQIWLLLPFVPDFRWMLERKDSPWYPTMRIFRQPHTDDWASVIAEIKREYHTL